MTIKECYDYMDADYRETIERLMSDKLIYKFNQKFLESDDYDNLVKALDEKDYETAFRMSHNLKGMSLNLGYRGLQEVSSAICEELRGGEPKADLNAMLAKVTEKYNLVLDGINKMSPV